jgi:hypothetical protein
MIKIIGLVPRKPGISREEFIEYYETKGAPMVLSCFPQIVKYIRSYPISDENIHDPEGTRSRELPYDSVTEAWIKDRSAFAEMRQSLANDPEKAARLANVLMDFIDMKRIVEYLAEERLSEI